MADLLETMLISKDIKIAQNMYNRPGRKGLYFLRHNTEITKFPELEVIAYVPGIL